MQRLASFCAFVSFLLLLTASNLCAEPWKKTLEIGFSLSQNSYSDNWVGGEAGSFTWTGLINGTFEKQFSPKFNFRNTSNLQFGQTASQDKETKDWHRPFKSTDKIDLDNLGRWTLHAFVDPFAAFRLQTQFLDASYDPVKRLFNPILLSESAGIAKILYGKDKDQLLTRLGFAVRENLNRAIVDTVGEKIESRNSTDGGLESVTDAQFKIAENIAYTGKLTLFKAFFFSKKDDFKGTPAENYWKAIDGNFENTLSATITKYITLNLYVQLLYDKQVSLKGRFKQTSGIGFTYKMI